jgi:hypothetical protein
MSAIKPCPFCGTPDGAHGPSLFTEQGKAFVGCVRCGARGPAVDAGDYTRDEYVIGRWNARQITVTTRQAPPFVIEDDG